jgi:2-keto-4-pentenoate hydratase/2-oxohepta-3-ene-1,7-dioic acid hydratase in catechol pathway
MLAPVQPPGELFQTGANYRTHVWEIYCAMRRAKGMSEEEASSAELRREYDRQTDERILREPPLIFQGNNHAISGAYDDIVLPARYGQNADWELELALVFGGTVRYATRENALDQVAGYLISNDISQRPPNLEPVPRMIPGIDWLGMKNSPGFFPTGPYLVPAAFVPDPMQLRIQLRLNGKTMQDSMTTDMIYDIRAQIEYLSHATILKAGDMLLTGTPHGNAMQTGRYLQPGDVIEGEITSLGLQRNHVVAETLEPR